MNQPRTEKRIQSEHLDQEFRKILCAIREHIPYINSNAYLMQCRVWLEKLSNPNINKVLRNLYLVELCGQIQRNKLLPPFNEAPPTGSLKSLTKILMNRKSFRLFQDLQRRKSKQSDLQSSSVTKIEGKGLVNTLSLENMLLCPRNSETWDCLKFSKLSLGLSKEVRNELATLPKIKHTSLRTERQTVSKPTFDFQNIDILRNRTLECGEHSANMQNDTRTKPYLTNEVEEIVIKKEGDSWSDLTDVSSDAEYVFRREERDLITGIMDKKKNVSGNFDQEHNYIQNEIQTDIIKSEKFNDFKTNDVPIFQCSDVEESNLKVPKDNNYISEDWKNTIDALQLRLSEMTQQNNELNAVILKLETQIEGIRNKSKEETENTIKMLENIHFEDITQLKEIHADKIFQLEKQFHATIEKLESDQQEKINKTNANCEQKILELSEQKEDITRRKDEEICRLTEVIQQQCTRITNDISSLQNQVLGCSCDKKLLLLKKCVSKMDKLFQRSEKEHLRQIDRLRQELEIKNTALQIQLKMQKAELVAETSSERQEEFEKILNSLEVKYIKMLEMHESQIMEMKKQDDEKIQGLKELLSQHGISYDDHDV